MTTTMFALFVCIGSFHCQYVDGFYATQAACEAVRDRYQPPKASYVYTCAQKAVPVWERTR